MHILQKLKALFLAPPNEAESYRHLVNRAWLVIERACFLLTTVGVLAAMFGVWSWYMESDARKMDRASKIYEITDGALRTIDASRLRADEVGQSDALNWLFQMGRDTETLNLNDLTLTGVSVKLPLLQPGGALLALRSPHFRHGGSQRISLDCPTQNVVVLSWIVLSDADLHNDEMCFVGTVLASRIRASRSTLTFAFSSVSKDAVISERMKQEVNLWEQGEGRGRTFPGGELPDEVHIEDSDLSHSKIEIDSDFTRIFGGLLAHSQLSSRSPVLRIDASNLRYAKISDDLLSDYVKQSEREEHCNEEAAKQLNTVTNTQNTADKYTSVTEKARIEGALVARLLSCESVVRGPLRHYFPRSPGFASSSTDRAKSADWQLIIQIRDSDIRDADLSSLPAKYIALENVCSNNRTKLPQGVVLTNCSTDYGAFWDRLKDSAGSISDEIAITRSAVNAGRLIKVADLYEESDYIPATIIEDGTNTVSSASFSDSATGFYGHIAELMTSYEGQKLLGGYDLKAVNLNGYGSYAGKVRGGASFRGESLPVISRF